MPEGPELLRSADELQRLVGWHIAGVGSLGGRYRSSPPEGLYQMLAEVSDKRVGPCNGRIEEVAVKGKFMHWSIRLGWSLWCTYGMSGQWQAELGKHTAVELKLRRGNEELSACFNDPRHFGTVKLVHDPDGVLTRAKLDSLGPDMLGSPPTHEVFATRLGMNPNRTLAEALMDQRCVSGVGNYLKAEALYVACLSPHRTCRSLTVTELENLRLAIVRTMRASYESRGATISTYRNVGGDKGGAQDRFAVYGRDSDPRGNPVVRELTLDGRTTHWCLAVQR